MFRNTFLISSTLLTLWGSSALAADAPVSPPLKAQPAKKQSVATPTPVSVQPVPSQLVSELITVSAARTPTRTDDIGTALTIVTEEQMLTQQRRTLPDILARQPGLNVVRSGGFGATTSILMRGNNANEVKVRLDGMDVNDGSSASGMFDAGQFVTDGLGRIEILRGPQSGLYGADAMAGVIDMTTAQGQGRFKPFVRIEGGLTAPSIRLSARAGARGASTTMSNSLITGWKGFTAFRVILTAIMGRHGSNGIKVTVTTTGLPLSVLGMMSPEISIWG